MCGSSTYVAMDPPGCNEYRLPMRLAMIGGDTKNGFVLASTRRAGDKRTQG